MFIRLFQSESKTWNIQHLLHKIGQMNEAILLIHAFLGCNTVFRIYGIGIDKITKSPKLLNICCDLPPTFYNQSVQVIGEDTVLALFWRYINKVAHQIVSI